MGKNMKKVLSYALGAILALGVGFSYAYAVGANDSNAFVTKTEWQAKFDQLDTALNNISKTIQDSDMDFVMSGPRLQASTHDGFENTGGDNNGGYIPLDAGSPYYAAAGNTSPTNRYLRTNNLLLQDLWNGRQSVTTHSFSSNGTNDYFSCRIRFALKTDVANVYIIVSVYYAGATAGIYMTTFDYVTAGDVIQDYSAAKTLKVTLSLDEWWPIYGDTAPTDQSKSSSYIYTARPNEYPMNSGFFYIRDNTGTWTFSNPGTGYITRNIVGNDITFTWDFPATTSSMKQFNTSSPYCFFNVLPLDMTRRKYGTRFDKVYINTSSLGTPIAKVYSPQKGCLALKNYMNGEIPILNE